MKRPSTTFTVLFIVVGLSQSALSAAVAARGAWQRSPPPVPTRAAVMQALQEADAYFQRGNPASDIGCGWVPATYAAGGVAHALLPGGNFSYIDAWAEANGYGACTRDSSHAQANNELCGATYIALYEAGGRKDDTDIAATRQVVEKEVASPAVDSWWWVDALFMAMPTWARLAAVTTDVSQSDAIRAKLYALYNDTSSTRGLWSAEHALYYRDDSYFNKTTPSGAPVFWSRGNGWAVAALARTLEALSSNAPRRAEYLGRFRTLAAKLVTLQGDDGFWRASLADAAQYPGPESTGTGLFAFGFAWGVVNGVLPQSPYGDAALRAWHGMTTIALQDGLVGYCQPAGGSPGPAPQNSTSPFCVGAFLLAGAEIAKLVPQ